MNPSSDCFDPVLLFASWLQEDDVVSNSQDYNQVRQFNLMAQPSKDMGGNISRRMVSGANGTVAVLQFARDASVPAHKHPNEQISHILEGKLEISASGKKYIVGKGEYLYLPSNIPHAIRALEDTTNLDFYTSVRRDWLEATSFYIPVSAPSAEDISEMPSVPPSRDYSQVRHFTFEPVAWEQVAPGIKRKYVFGANGMVALFKFAQGALGTMHHHQSEQLICISRGQMEMTFSDCRRVVNAGEFLYIPPGTPHSFRALAETLETDFFSPVRLDWLLKMD